MRLKGIRAAVVLAAVFILALLPETGRAGYVANAVRVQFGLSSSDYVQSGTSINGGGVFKWQLQGQGLGYGTVTSDSLGVFSDSSFQAGTVPVTYQPLSFPGFGGSSFNTFCIEVAENITPGKTYTYELTHDLAGTPNDNNGTQPNGMGKTAATNLRYLFGTYFSTLDTSTEYKAFQLAIWEIVKDSGTGLDLSSGGFTYSVSGGLKTQVETYLNKNNWTVEAADLVVLTKDGRQDQIGIVAPSPPALALSLAGVLPLAAYRWRARRRRT